MEWKNGRKFEHKPGYEVPEIPRLLADIAEAELQTFASETEIPLHELMYLQKQIMGSGLAHKLYKRYEDSATKPISAGDYPVLEVKIVPSIFTSTENAIIEAESSGAYIVSDAYAGYSISMMAMKKIAKTGKRRLREDVVYIGLKYLGDNANLIEFFLNDGDDESIDVHTMIEGWQDLRKPATPLQKVILAKTLEDLLDPYDPLKG